MAEVFTNPFSNTAASLLADESLPAFNFAQLEQNPPRAQTFIGDKQMKECARNLYEEMMKYAANVLFQALVNESVKKPVQRYSSSIKALTVCSIYLVAVENCQVRTPPRFLVSLLLEAMRLGDKIEQIPSGQEIIASYGWQDRADLIENVAALSMNYIGCNSKETRNRVAEGLSAGGQARFDMLQRALEAMQH